MILKESILKELQNIAAQYSISQLILFGSRATDECFERSDIDLAANFKTNNEYMMFCDRVEEISTLLMFDVVNLNSDMVSLDLRKSIQETGVVLYEKV